MGEHFSQTRVLLTTGYSDMASAAETRFPILRKPFELSALERAVREAIASKEAVTPDLGGSATTRMFTSAVLKRLK